MFTGIIKATGRLADVDSRGADRRMRFVAPTLEPMSWSIGASIAVNGVCLTAVELDADSFAADVSAETLRVTTLGSLVAGAPVNLEPSLRVGDSLDGHFVSGHVDGVGAVRAIGAEGRAQLLSIEVPQPLSRYIARKGSIAVDGISLTVNAVAGEVFEVTIVPHTRTATIVQHYDVGTAVNIEVDIIARYLERFAGA